MERMQGELETLVRRLRAGVEREDSARRLDALLRTRLQRYFVGSGSAPSEAEDLVQQTLLRVFESVGALRSEGSFLAWLFAIARNVRRSALRGRRREDALVAREGDFEKRCEQLGDGGSEDVGAARLWLAAVSRAVATLPEQQRRCLVLFARDGLAYAEIGELLGLSGLTVRNHLAEARRRLRRNLDRDPARGNERD
jgi:RNA polymerase sigma-70 factor, ECF subfamily